MLSFGRAGLPDPAVLSWINFQEFSDAGCATGQSGASSTFALANTIYLVPFTVTRSWTLNSCWWINGAAVAGNVDVGLWTVSGTTATRVASSTAVAQANISAIQTQTFPTTTITPGQVYHMAIGCSSTTAAFWRGAFGATPVLKALGVFQASAHPQTGSTATVATVATANLPIFGLAEYTL